MNQRSGPLHSLTALRFVAASFVFVFHFGATFAEHSGVPGPVATLLHNGYLGVSVFFVLSGFILFYTYGSKLNAPGFVHDFAVARFARIYPVYLVALLLALPLQYGELDWATVLKCLALVQTWTLPASDAGYRWVFTAWTISIEFAFYIAFPCLAFGLVRLRRRGVHVAALAMAALIIGFGLSAVTPDTAFAGYREWLSRVPIPILRIPEFAFGMGLCAIYLDPRQSLGTRHPRLAACGLTVAILALLMSGSSPQVAGLVSVLAGLLILQLARSEPVLGYRVLILLGGASYSLYILQSPIRAWVRLASPNLLGQILNPVIAISCAVAAYLLIEEPMRRVVRSAFTRLRPQSETDREVAAAIGASGLPAGSGSDR